MRDAEQVAGVTWHFFRSPITGSIGPSAPLSEFLTLFGIKIAEQALAGSPLETARQSRRHLEVSEPRVDPCAEVVQSNGA
jgi:hypothetical protein